MRANGKVHSSPLSPVERDVTAVMMADDESSSKQHHSSAAASTFPHNASSWELLEIFATSSTAAAHDDDAGAQLAAMPLVNTNEEAEKTRKATIDAAASTDLAVVLVPLSMEGEVQETMAAAAAAAADAAADNGYASPAKTASSEWSLVSTPAEVQLSSGEAATAAQHTALPFPTDHNTTTTAVLSFHGTDKNGPRFAAPLSVAGRIASLTSITSPPPSPAPLTQGTASFTVGGWSATSYEEVCMTDLLRGNGDATARVVSSIVSVCTTPSPVHSAAFHAEASATANLAEEPQHEYHCAGAEEALPALTVSVDEEEQHYPMMEDSSVPSPPFTQLLSWLHKVRGESQKGVVQPSRGLSLPSSFAATAPAEAPKATPKTSTTPSWSARRLSFLSSSAAATIALSSTFIPRSSPAPFPDIHKSFAHPVDVTPTATPAASSPSPFSSPSVWTTEVVAQWWSKTRVTCAGGSQRALRSLRQICDYVWMDLKEHWYPQLRLVLGDHSCAGKVRRACRARRFIARDRSERHEPASESRAQLPRWRSVSAPCLVSADELRTAKEPVRAAMATSSKKWRGQGTATDHYEGPPFSLTQQRLWLCMTMTADAVASAAQGLLVFLL